jgi:hypothetical protein
LTERKDTGKDKKRIHAVIATKIQDKAKIDDLQREKIHEKAYERNVSQGEEDTRVRLVGEWFSSFSSSATTETEGLIICALVRFRSFETFSFFFGLCSSSLVDGAFRFFELLRVVDEAGKEEDAVEEDARRDTVDSFFFVNPSAFFCFPLLVLIHVLACLTVKTSASSNLFAIRSTIRLALMLGLSTNISSRNAICSAVLYCDFSFAGLIAQPRPSFIEEAIEGCQEMIE